MGQYYLTINLDKKQYLNPHKFGDGLKLLEFGSSGSGTMCGLAVLLANSNGRGGGDLHSDKAVIGSWAGDRIVIAGDYSDKVETRADEDGKAVEWNWYDIASHDFEDVSDRVIEALLDDKWLRQDFLQLARQQAKWGGGAGVSELIWPGLKAEVEASEPPAEQGGPHLRPDFVIST